MSEPETAPEITDSPDPTAKPCSEEPPPAPVCGSDLLRVPLGLAFHPERGVPPQDIKRELDRVAAAMHDRPRWQLLRVEVFSNQDPGASRGAARREMLASQARADAILSYLYRRKGVSAERMDAIGYGFKRPASLSAERWPVQLRLVHRAEPSRAGAASARHERLATRLGH